MFWGVVGFVNSVATIPKFAKNLSLAYSTASNAWIRADVYNRVTGAVDKTYEYFTRQFGGDAPSGEEAIQSAHEKGVQRMLHSAAQAGFASEFKTYVRRSDASVQGIVQMYSAQFKNQVLQFARSLQNYDDSTLPSLHQVAERLGWEHYGDTVDQAIQDPAFYAKLTNTVNAMLMHTRRAPIAFPSEPLPSIDGLQAHVVTESARQLDVPAFRFLPPPTEAPPLEDGDDADIDLPVGDTGIEEIDRLAAGQRASSRTMNVHVQIQTIESILQSLPPGMADSAVHYYENQYGTLLPSEQMQEIMRDIQQRSLQYQGNPQDGGFLQNYAGYTIEPWGENVAASIAAWVSQQTYNEARIVLLERTDYHMKEEQLSFDQAYLAAWQDLMSQPFFAEQYQEVWDSVKNRVFPIEESEGRQALAAVRGDINQIIHSDLQQGIDHSYRTVYPYAKEEAITTVTGLFLGLAFLIQRLGLLKFFHWI